MWYVYVYMLQEENNKYILTNSIESHNWRIEFLYTASEMSSIITPLNFVQRDLNVCRINYMAASSFWRKDDSINSNIKGTSWIGQARLIVATKNMQWSSYNSL